MNINGNLEIDNSGIKLKDLNKTTDLKNKIIVKRNADISQLFFKRNGNIFHIFGSIDKNRRLE